jgi:hypothetical protein
MDIDEHLSSELDDEYDSTLEGFRKTQKSIENRLPDQNSITFQAEQDLGNSVEDFVWACHTFITADSAAIRNEEGGHELRGAAVKSMLSRWLDEITQETATLTAGPVDRGLYISSNVNSWRSYTNLPRFWLIHGATR